MLFLVSAAAARAEDDIVDTAVKAGSFKTLVAAVKAAGLVDTLKGDGPFTVFAPTDAAFKKLPKGTLESLPSPGLGDAPDQHQEICSRRNRIALARALPVGTFFRWPTSRCGSDPCQCAGSRSTARLTR